MGHKKETAKKSAGQSPKKKELVKQSTGQSPKKKELVKQSTGQSPKKNSLKDALLLVAGMTGEAKKAAEEKPFTSSGKPKSELKGATIFTNAMKEEGIEAHKRGIVPKPNMQGGLENEKMHAAAETALKMMELSEQQPPSLPDGENS